MGDGLGRRCQSLPFTNTSVPQLGAIRPQLVSAGLHLDPTDCGEDGGCVHTWCARMRVPTATRATLPPRRVSTQGPSFATFAPVVTRCMRTRRWLLLYEMRMAYVSPAPAIPQVPGDTSKHLTGHTARLDLVDALPYVPDPRPQLEEVSTSQVATAPV